MTMRRVISYGLDGSLLKLWRLKPLLKPWIYDLLCAVDTGLVTHIERILQRLSSCFAEAAQRFGIEVNLKKMEVLHQSASREEYRSPHITIDGTELKTVQQFTFLGWTISSDARTSKEVDSILEKASGASGRLYQGVWSNKHTKEATKISVYRAIVPTIDFPHVFHQRCLCTIINIYSSDFVISVEVLEQAVITSIEAMLLK